MSSAGTASMNDVAANCRLLALTYTLLTSSSSRTAAAPRELDQKFDLAILMRVEPQVVRRIFQRNLPPDPLLHARDVVDHPPQRVGGARHRQQIGSIHALPGTPGQMLRHERGLDAFDQRREPLQMLVVRRASAASDSATPCSETGCDARMRSSQASRGPPSTM